MIKLTFLIGLLSYIFYFLQETGYIQSENNLDNGFVILENKDEIYNYLSNNYKILNYKYSIKGCTLQTFHRDVTSSQYIFKTKYPVYTYIEYFNKGPVLSVCPGSHKTVPFLFQRAQTIYNNNNSRIGILFNCDLVHAGALNNLGNTHKLLKDFESAKQAYKQALQIDPNFANSLQNLANLKFDLNNYDDAIELYKKAIKSEPKNFLTYYKDTSKITVNDGDYIYFDKILENGKIIICGFAKKITDESEKEKARELILKVTEAFSEYMHDDFLIANDVIGYYKIQPTTIKYVDFYAEKQFEWMEVPENRIGLFKEVKNNILNTLKYWITVVRAPFLTATIASSIVL